MNINIIRSRLYRLFAVGVLLLNFNQAHAISYIMNGDSLIELQIAKDGPTRINIEDEKINDIFIHPQEAAEMVVHDSGCLFILPQPGKSKIYLTLIGENGTTQDLVLRFTGKTPTPIKLIKFSLEKEASKTKLTNQRQENNNGCKQKTKRCKNN